MPEAGFPLGVGGDEDPGHHPRTTGKAIGVTLYIPSVKAVKALSVVSSGGGVREKNCCPSTVHSPAVPGKRRYNREARGARPKPPPCEEV